MIFRNCEKFQNSTPATFIVVGVARGGTSLLAGLLHHMGIHMGDSITKPNYENPIVKIIFKENNDVAINSFIAESNRHPYWGLKYPFLSSTFVMQAGKFTNPCILYIKKNFNEVAKRRSQIVGQPYLISYIQTWVAYLMLDLRSRFAGLPTVITQYSEIVGEPEQWVTEFCAHLNLHGLDKQRAVDFIREGNSNYRRWVNRSLFNNFHGHIDGISANEIHGWACRKHDNSPLVVDVLLGEDLFASGIAKLYREDIAKALPGHDGLCGYHICFPRVLSADEQKNISVRIGDMVLCPENETILDN
ncbi:MAG: hypothetical protein EPO31_11715 [Gammaproteobacteria bacterium]|jgi:hypothetical protein|nr:MAG: hypothetical protein EPO31_11715 [Gammaproteobacteria bacterium]